LNQVLIWFFLSIHNLGCFNGQLLLGEGEELPEGLLQTGPIGRGGMGMDIGFYLIRSGTGQQKAQETRGIA